MASSSRVTRGTTSAAEDVGSLSAREKLIFAQAVYEYGSKAWAEVSKLLSRHPLISRPRNYFSPQSCLVIYTQLMGQISLERSEITEGVHAPAHLKLAQYHYKDRFLELKGQILAEEAKFKVLVAEIDEIRQGLWDERIINELGGNADSSIAEVASTVPLIPESQPKQDVETALADGHVENRNGLLPVQDDNGTAVDKTSARSRSNSPAVVAEEFRKEENQVEHQDSGLVANELAEDTPGPLSQEYLYLEGGENSIGTERSPESHTTPDSPSSLAVLVERLPTETEPASLQVSKGPGEVEPAAESASETIAIHNIANNDWIDIVPEGRSEEREVEPSAVEEPPLRQTHAEGKESQKIVDMTAGADTKENPSFMTRETPGAKEVFKPCSSGSERGDRDENPLVRKESVDSVELGRGGSVASDSIVTDQNETAGREDGEDEPTTGPSSRHDQKRKVSDVESMALESSRDRKKAREESEPTDEAESPATPSTSALAPRNLKERKRFQNVIYMLHSQISQHRNGNIFHNPIKKSEAPDYHEIVKRPMDLKTIKARVKDGLVNTSIEFQRDIFLMFANSMMYNRPNSDIYNMAEEMMLESEAQISTFRQTEGYARTRL